METSKATWNTFRKLIETPDLPDLGPAPRTTRLPLAELNRKVEEFLDAKELSAAIRPLVRSAALLWHDYLDESHAISQNIHNANGSFLHAIMHRREPDYANAKYWFNRAGRHPIFPEIARQTERFLDGQQHTKLLSLLVPRGQWDPFAFVDACEATVQRLSSGDINREILCALQQLEFDALLSDIFPGR